MKIKNYIKFTLSGLLNTLFLLLLILAILIGLRIASSGQSANEDRLSSKREYLQKLSTHSIPDDARPNIVFVLYDDMGYGDIGVGASTHAGMIRTPNLDQLAAAGVSFTNFYSPAPVCTPSRAGFLTGRTPVRAGLPNVVFPSGSSQDLLFFRAGKPDVNTRLPEEEITLAEVLKAVGYRTGMVGKWHLGDVQPSLPNDFGFDHFFGSLYSNDMEPFALYRNRSIEVSAPVDQHYLSAFYSDESIRFIQDSSGEPFFLYLAHNFPHIPLFVRESRSGQSDGGLYGDVLEELDEGIGKLVDVLRQQGKLENTLFIVTSDNGPWFLGSSGGNRQRKGSTFEGGMKVPFIAHWPAAIAGGRVESGIAMGMDLLPSVLDFLELPAPQDRILDGISIRGLLMGEDSSPNKLVYYFDGETLFAVRDQRFKYRGPKSVAYGTDEAGLAFPISQQEWLFDLAADPSESYDVSERYPDDLARLRDAFEAKIKEIEANKRGWL